MAALLLETPTGASIEAYDDQDEATQGEVDKVEHVWLRLRNRHNMLSDAIRKVAISHKGLIKTGPIQVSHATAN